MKNVVKMLLCMAVTASLLTGCGNKPAVSNDETSAKNSETEEDSPVADTEETEIVLAAADAVLTGQGINAESQVVDTVYVEDLHAITNVGTESTITYTVPEEVEGSYDIYLDFGKSPYAVGTTPVSVIVNDGKEYVSPAAIINSESDYSDLFSMGKFLMAENVDLTAGDTLMEIGRASCRERV